MSRDGRSLSSFSSPSCVFVELSSRENVEILKCHTICTSLAESLLQRWRASTRLPWACCMLQSREAMNLKWRLHTCPSPRKGLGGIFLRPAFSLRLIVLVYIGDSAFGTNIEPLHPAICSHSFLYPLASPAQVHFTLYDLDGSSCT